MTEPLATPPATDSGIAETKLAIRVDRLETLMQGIDNQVDSISKSLELVARRMRRDAKLLADANQRIAELESRMAQPAQSST